MPDLTHVFRATVQDLSQASGTFGGRLASTPPTKSKPDPWLKEAHQIVRTPPNLLRVCFCVVFFFFFIFFILEHFVRWEHCTS